MTAVDKLDRLTAAKSLPNVVNLRPPKIKKIPKDTYMYNKLEVPGVLIECGFLSNGKERKKLVTSKYQQKIAKSITKGILKYF